MWHRDIKVKLLAQKMQRDGFITPGQFSEIEETRLGGPNGWLLFSTCNEGIDLGRSVQQQYNKMAEQAHSKRYVALLNDSPFLKQERKGIIVTRFEDRETCPELPEHVAGSNVFVFQYTHRLDLDVTPNDAFMQLAQMIRTLKAHGAQTITAVTPYMASSRQDKPSDFHREATLARLNADILRVAGANGVLVYHPHADAIRGFYEPDIRYTALSGLDLFIEITSSYASMKEVVTVSTDAGGAKATIHFGNALEVDSAIGNKYRPEKERAHVLGIIGNMSGKRIAIVGDDESVSFTSLRNVAKPLHEDLGIEEIIMLISHNKVTPDNIPKLIEAHEKYGLKEFHVTDSIPQTKEMLALPFIHVHPLAERLARVINRMHYNISVSELFYHPERNKRSASFKEKTG